MGVIDSELEKFKTSVEPQIGSMNTMCSTIVSKIQSLSTSATTAKNSIDNYYSSSNKNTILSKFDRISDVYSKISASVNGDLKGMISSAQGVIDLVDKLIEINKDIKTQEDIISNLDDTSQDQSVIESNIKTRDEANGIITQKNTEFDTTHEKAKTALTNLKNMDSSISFVSEFSSSNATANPEDLQYGTFELRKFVSSSGEEIEYYIYVPDYGKDVKNLPVMLYMHGSISSYTDTNWCNYGLTGLIKDQSVTPSGIVIMPHIKNHKDYDTLKELTDTIVEEYDCDTDRISISGHSAGGITTYDMLSKYPGYFSCAIPISGCNYASITDQSVAGTRIWSFVGATENDNQSEATRTDTCVGAVNKVNKLGGDAYSTVMPGGHSITNKNTYSQKYTSPEGKEVYVLDWAFEQEKG